MATSSQGICNRADATPRDSVSMLQLVKPFKATAENATGVKIPDELFDQFVKNAQAGLTTAWTGKTQDKMLLEQEWLQFLKSQDWDRSQWVTKRLADMEKRIQKITAQRDERVEREMNLQQRELDAQDKISRIHRERTVKKVESAAEFEQKLEERRQDVLQGEDEADAMLEIKHLKLRRQSARDIANGKFKLMTTELDEFEQMVLEEASAQFMGGAIASDKEERKRIAEEKQKKDSNVAVKTFNAVVGGASNVIEGAANVVTNGTEAVKNVTAGGAKTDVRPKKKLDKDFEDLKNLRVKQVLKEMKGELENAQAQSILVTAEKKLAEIEKKSQAKSKELEILEKEEDMKKKEAEFLVRLKASEEEEDLRRITMKAQARQRASMKEQQTTLDWNSTLLDKQAVTAAALQEQTATIEQALHITAKDMEEAQAVKRQIQFARIMWLMVIVGCELDLYGFTLAAPDYWLCGSDGNANDRMTNWVMRAMLIVGPIGYALATYMYMTFLEEEPAAGKGFRETLIDVESQQKVRVRDPSLVPCQTGKAAAGIPEVIVPFDRMVTEATRESVTLQFYHFVPIVRYYLLVKDPQVNDVESLFRVNALSSFSLGFAQVFCMMLGLSNQTLEWNAKLRVGVFAQLVNGFMTYLYFFTEKPAMMKAQMGVEALQMNTTRSMQEEFIRYNQIAEQASNRLGNKFPQPSDLDGMPANERQLVMEVHECRCKVIRDINQMANCQLEEPLRQFSTTQLFEWRTRLATRNIAAYGQLVSV